MYLNGERSDDPVSRLVSHHLLGIANAAHWVGIEIRWPTPPFIQSQIQQADSEWAFQLNWTLRLLNIQNEMSDEEREALPMLSTPYSEEEIGAYVQKVKRIKKQRSFWSRFRRPSALPPDVMLRFSRCIQVLRGNWRVGHQLGDADWSMIRIPKGYYFQGGGELYKEEGPKRPFIMTNYWISTTVVSQRIWSEVMNKNPASHLASNSLPQVNVSWSEAIFFCNALSIRYGLQPVYTLEDKGSSHPVAWQKSANGYRLPTEAEWEYAARGTIRGLDRIDKSVDVETVKDSPIPTKEISSSLYSGSELVREVAWCVENSKGKLQEMAKKRANSFGLYDMSGNVREWCWDGYGAYETEGGHFNEQAEEKVCRGGSFKQNPVLCRVSSRSRSNYSFADDMTGFRVVCGPNAGTLTPSKIS